MSDWQLISTAPKDGTWIIGWRSASGEMECAYFNPHGNHWETAADVEWQSAPTHWLPLPEPPHE